MTTTCCTRRGFLRAAGAGALALAVPGRLWSQPARRRPNIIFIMADDLGYGDLGCYGHPDIATPHLDELARNGLRFTDFHSNGPLCTPTRASLLTGRYQQRVGLHEAPADERYTMVKAMELWEETFAEVVRRAGYTTAIIGKWHLGDHLPYLPTRQGFDEYFGLPYSNDMHPLKESGAPRPPLPVYRGESVIEFNPDQDYLTQRYTREAVDFIRRNRRRPFMLYLPHNMPHQPVAASPDFTRKRFSPEQMATIQGLNKESRAFLYPASVEEIDWSVGQIVKTLRELELENDTLIFFTSDNGPALGSAGFCRGGKGSLYEGGHRVPGIACWPGHIPAGRTTDETTLTMDWLPTMAGLAGVTLPEGQVDGVDLSGLLLEGRPLPVRHTFWGNQGDLAVREGPWKLLVLGKRQAQPQVELYHLVDDPGETQNLAAAQPERVERLRRVLDEWVAATGGADASVW